jgi:hypothetical protein
VLIAGPVSALQVDCETAVRCIVAIDRARDTRDALNPILVEVYTDAIMLATHDCPAVTKWVARGRKLCDTAKAAAHKVLEVCPRTTGLDTYGASTEAVSSATRWIDDVERDAHDHACATPQH